jgi:hypothetical protein
MSVLDRVIKEYDKSIEQLERDLRVAVGRLQVSSNELAANALGDMPVQLYAEKVASLAQGIAVLRQQIDGEKAYRMTLLSIKNGAAA